MSEALMAADHLRALAFEIDYGIPARPESLIACAEAIERAEAARRDRRPAPHTPWWRRLLVRRRRAPGAAK